MRHRWYLIPVAILFASPLAAQEPPREVKASTDSVAAADLLLRLGLKPVPRPFAIELPRAPGLDAPWLRSRFTNWAAEWSRAARAGLDERRGTLWLERRFRDPAAGADTVAYLPLPPARDTTRNDGLIPGVVSDYADIGMVINGRGELGGSWVRYQPCTPGFQFNCNPSLFPQLKPDVQFGVRVGGTISDRVHVNVDYDQRREFDAANNINVYYQGLEDEILQRLEVGDVSIRLPPSRYLTQGVPAGNFGFKAEGQLGPLDFQAVWAQQKGDLSTREFRLGGSRGPGGLVQDAELVLDDADYVKGQFFFVIDPDSLAGAPHVDILALRASDAPGSLRPAPGSIQVFRDERPSFLNPQQVAQLGYFRADGIAPGDALKHTGTFRRLTPGEDFLAHSSGLWIHLRSPLRPDEALAISYLTETGELVGTINPEQAPSGVTPALRLIRGPATIHQPGQPTWRFEMHQVYRLDSSNGVEASSVDLKISLGELSGGATFRDFGAEPVPFLKLLGLDEDSPRDQVDAAQIYQPARSAFGGSSQEARIGGTYIVFPTLRPFAEPPPVPSARLTPEQARDLLAPDTNAVIYENPDPVARDGGGRFRLNFQYRVRVEGLVSSFNLGAFGIREETERIYVGGQQLTRGVDYDIDYDIGTVTLRDAQTLFSTNPDAEIRATWEQKSVFQIAPTSVFGVNSRYQLGERGELNFMGLYQSEKSLMTRPQLGLEPSSIFLGGASGRFDLGGAWLDRALDRVPGLSVSGVSFVNLTGEVAFSLPNPNTHGNTYLDDFEGSDEIPLAVDRNLWRLGSRPQVPDGATDVLPLPMAVDNAAKMVWQDFYDDGDGIVGPINPRSIDQQINVAGASFGEPALRITFAEDALPAGDRVWRSLTTVLSTTGRDMTRSEFLEFYVAHLPDQQMALVFDIGTVSEDAFYFNEQGETMGQYDDGRQWGLGVLDEEARLSEREIWSPDSDARGLWNQSCETTPDRAFPLGDPNANCTRGNGRIDTEDLDGNGGLDVDDGAYYRFVVRLDGASPYLVRGPQGTGTVFSLYRIPLRGPGALPVNGANPGTWRFIKHLRMTVAGAPAGLAPMILARPRIVGSRWTKRDVHGILAGLTGAGPGLGAASARLEVGPVSAITDGAAYQSPPGVRDELLDPTTALGAGSVEYNEKSLRLRYSDVEPDDRAEVYFRYPQQPRNFLGYRQLRLWAVAREGSWGPQGDERLVVKIGTDARNYYLYQTRLQPAVGTERGVRQEDWLPELVIDFERWFDLQAEAQQEVITQPRAPGDPLVVWSEDSTYAVVLEDGARAPNLRAVREISFAVYNAGGATAAGGDVWLNEMRLSGGVTDAGFAGHLNLDVHAADFLTTNISYASQGAFFRQLNNEASYQTSGDLFVSTTAQLGSLAPTAWGLSLPVSVSHTRTGQTPTFLERTDVRADRLEGLRETGSNRTAVSMAISKRTPTANPWLGLVLDGAQFRMGYNTAATNAVTTQSQVDGVNAGLNYARQPATRAVDPLPGFVEGLLRGILPASIERSEAFRRLTGARFRWTPESITFATSYFGQKSQSLRFDRILRTDADTAVRPIESQRQGLENNARIAFRPFQPLTADLTLTSSRDLLPSARATDRELEREALDAARSSLAGTDIGWETNRSMTSQVAFRPEVTRWLRPGFTYSARFNTDRNASYLEIVRDGEDSTAVLQRRFRGDRQISRTLLIEPTGLWQALFGTGVRRGVAGRVQRIAGALQPVDLTWTSSLNSQFERESVMPGLGYQLGGGDLESVRIIGGDTAAAAGERSQFRVRTGLQLPFQTSVDLNYGTSEGRFLDLRGGDRRQQERTWPDIRVSWRSIPLPEAVRGIVLHASASTGYQLRESEDVLGGELTEQHRTSDDRSIPVQLSLGLAGGISASYSGSFGSGQVHDATGDAERSTATHAVQLAGTFRAPGKLRDRFENPITGSLRYSYNGQLQCRARSFVEDQADCVPFVDVLARSLNLTLDTMIDQLNVGLQMSYTDRKSFVGTRSGSSQFQLGIFGQFHFQAGSLGGIGR